MPEEREYTFNVNSPEKTVTLKESELTEHHKDLMLSDLIKYFTEMPPEIQHRFMLIIKLKPNKISC